MARHYDLTDQATVLTSRTTNPAVVLENTLQGFSRHGPFRRVYALIDQDDRSDVESFRQAQVMVTNHTLPGNAILRLLISNPSWDVWFLFHYELLTAAVSGDAASKKSQVRKRLADLMPGGYRAGSIGLFNKTRHLLPGAILRSQKVMHDSRLPHNTKHMKTELHELVTFLVKLGEKKKKQSQSPPSVPVGGT